VFFERKKAALKLRAKAVANKTQALSSIQESLHQLGY